MTAPHSLRPPIAGRYELVEVLGHGGMGVVWRGIDQLLHRPVAVKEIPLLPGDPDEMSRHERGIREARAAARVSHPHAVTVFDLVDADDRLYLVMELVDAPTLSEVVKNDGPLEPEAAAQLGHELVGALDAAHALGVVHRDVKPSNVMMAAGGAKLADFGIANLKDEPGITLTGRPIGSPRWMAPERARGLPAGPPSDLWALGAVLYYAVEGRPPFDREEAIATLAAIATEPPAPWTRLGPLAPLVLDLLAKDPHLRPTPFEIRRRLDAIRPLTPSGGLMLPPVVAAAAVGDGAIPDHHVAPAPVVPSLTAQPTITPDPVAPTAMMGGPEVGGEALAGHDPSPYPEVVWDDEVDPDDDYGPVRPRARTLIAVLIVALLAAAGGAFALTRNTSSPVAALPGSTAAASSSSSPATTVPPSTAPPAPATTGASAATGAPATTAAPAAAPTTAPPVSAAPTTAAPSTRAPAEGVAAGWTSYVDPSSGYSISYPAGWSVIRNGTLTDFRDPDGGRYLRVDWTDHPGPSAQKAWEDFEPRFASGVSGYERIRMDPTTFHGYQASTWEYRYQSGGATLHAVDLGFVTGPNGFALNFQTTEGAWDSSQSLFRQFQDSFSPPA